MDFEQWDTKQRIEQQYERAINRLVSKIWELINIDPDNADPYEISRRIARLVRSKAYAEYAKAAASQMIMGVFADNGRTWRQAARANMRGAMVQRSLQRPFDTILAAALQAQIDRNVTIIKTLPQDIAADVVEYIRQQSMSGRRAGGLAPEIMAKFPEETSARAALIARTETSKTTTAITRSRAENLGINWYVWRTSDDGRVRSSHAHMDGVLVSWTDPPSPELLIGEKSYGHYHAGEIFNCRCYPEPVIRLELINWPCDVYRFGRIEKNMSRAEFERIWGGAA